MKHLLALATFPLALLCMSGPAAAQPTDEPQGSAPTADHARLHDGFYLRLAAGGGALSSQDHVDNVTTDSNTAIHAGGGAFEASVGGSPQRGLVVGGTFFAQAAELGRVTNSDGSTTMNKTSSFVLFGAMLDMYPNPRSGFHFSGAIGPALLTTTEDDHVNRRWHTSAGGAISFATGYDWWIADQWSLGFLVRATGGRLWGSTSYDSATDKTTSEPSSQRSVGTISVLFSALFH